MYSSSFDFLEKNEDYQAILNQIKQTEIIYYFPPYVIDNKVLSRIIVAGLRTYCEFVVKYLMTVHGLPALIKLDDCLSVLKDKNILNDKEKEAFYIIKKYGNGLHANNPIEINDKIVRILFEQSFLIAKWLFYNYYDNNVKLPSKYKKPELESNKLIEPYENELITQDNEHIEHEQYIKAFQISIQENNVNQNKVLFLIEQQLRRMPENEMQLYLKPKFPKYVTMRPIEKC